MDWGAPNGLTRVPRAAGGRQYAGPTRAPSGAEGASTDGQVGRASGPVTSADGQRPGGNGRVRGGRAADGDAGGNADAGGNGNTGGSANAGGTGPAGGQIGIVRAADGPAAARRYVNVCVEVLNGFRPAAHLRPLTAADGFSAVVDQLVRRTVRARASPTARRLARRMVRVRRFRLCEPIEGVTEAAVVLDDGRMCWAMAVRMERQPRGWLCALVQVV